MEEMRNWNPWEHGGVTQSAGSSLTLDDVYAAMAALPVEPRAGVGYNALITEESPVVFAQRWDMATTFNDVLRTRPSTPIAINNVAPPGRLWRRYQRNCARRARDVRLHQRKQRLARRQRRAQQRKHEQGKRR